MTGTSTDVANSKGDNGAADERVGTLAGDRVCLSCAYNLIGQPIMRERHYRMLIVRCPECGTVVALQEYPLLGSWANRWAALLAALWFLILLGMLLICGVTIAGLAQSVGREAAGPYMEWLGKHQLEWLEVNNPQQYDVATASGFPANQYIWIFDMQWWNSQDPDALLAQAGGWTGIADWSALRHWWGLGLWSAAFGIFWAGVMMKFRRRRLLAFGMLILATAALFAYLLGQAQAFAIVMGINIMQVAMDQLCPPFTILGIAFAAIPLSLGLVFGRPILRAVIRLLLVPRHASALAGLWLCDGLPPPRFRS